MSCISFANYQPFTACNLIFLFRIYFQVSKKLVRETGGKLRDELLNGEIFNTILEAYYLFSMPMPDG